MVGELDVAIADQTATISLTNEKIVFHISDFKTARALLKTRVPDWSLGGRLLRKLGAVVYVQIGQRKPVEIFPRPGWVVRLLSPAIRGLIKSE